MKCLGQALLSEDILSKMLETQCSFGTISYCLRMLVFEPELASGPNALYSCTALAGSDVFFGHSPPGLIPLCGSTSGFATLCVKL